MEALFGRIIRVFTSPREVWQEIAIETPSLTDLYVKTWLPLAAFYAIAGAVGMMLFGISAIFMTIKVGPMAAVMHGVTVFIGCAISTPIVAEIIRFWAQQLGGNGDRVRAHQFVIHTWMPTFVAGALQIITFNMIAALIGIVYAIFLFCYGLRPMFAKTEDTAAKYQPVIHGFASWFTSVIVLLPIMFIWSFISPAGSAFSPKADDVTISIPGLGKLNTKDLEKEAKKWEEIGKKMEEAAPNLMKAGKDAAAGNANPNGPDAAAMKEMMDMLSGQGKSGEALKVAMKEVADIAGGTKGAPVDPNAKPGTQEPNSARDMMKVIADMVNEAEKAKAQQQK